ncbi:hypothetical protein KAU33_00400 [Candidatus Dependentiae bacterium]|nr:hypothetical protein [Candidatus Dependentiae bacterium]
MKLPRNNKKLDQLFQNSTPAKVKDFSSGQFYIDMLTITPTLRWMKHRKVFKQTPGGIFGNNILLKKNNWGNFFLEEKKCIKFPELKVVVINYDSKENSFLSNIIRDEVRYIKAGEIYLGRFNLVLFGKPRFWGYFSMTKRKDF